MSPEEAEMAEKMYAAIQAQSANSNRSRQAATFKVGVSDLGFCSERLRRMLLGQTPDDTDLLKAWIGTALGDYAERAYQLVYPDAILQAEITVTLHGQNRTYVLPGHPDMIIPSEGMVVDGKTKFGLTVVERTGPSRSNEFQRHLYAKGVWEAGYFGDLPLEKVRVANVYLDRAGIEERLHVDIAPFNPDIVREAEEWLDEVVYAYTMTATGSPTEAPKDPPREMCKRYCGFFSVCRQFDTDAEGLITATETLTALDMYVEGLRLGREADKLKREAKAHLQGVSGSNGKVLVRWVHVNGTDERKGYDKIDITEMT